MQPIFRPSTPADVATIADLLVRVNGGPPDTPYLRRDVLEWKYWAPRSDWPDPRSYVGEADGRVVVHLGAWPCVLQVNGVSRRGAHFFDWVADATMVGGGLAVLRHFTRQFDFIYAIGGTAASKVVRQRIGFRPAGEAWKAARPLRAWRYRSDRTSGGWRLAARIGRNLLWSARPSCKVPRGWDYEQTTPDQIATSFSGMTEIPRSTAFFQYLADCPMCRSYTYRVTEHGHSRGSFVLTMVRHQARLAVWIDDPSTETHRIVYSLAQQAAREMPDAFEIVVMGSGPTIAAAAVAAGFRVRKKDDVVLKDVTGIWPSGPPELEFQSCDSDGIVLDDGEASFMC